MSITALGRKFKSEKIEIYGTGVLFWTEWSGKGSLE